MLKVESKLLKVDFGSMDVKAMERQKKKNLYLSTMGVCVCRAITAFRARIYKIQIK
jgi:hypothetical protein